MYNEPNVYLVPWGAGGTVSLEVGTHCQTTALALRRCPHGSV